MISSIFHTLFYNPIYNVLVFLVGIIPGGDVGVAVILLTLLVRLLLLPLFLSSSRAQRAMKVIEPQLKELREKHKDDKELQAKRMMELYRENKINPLASIVPLLIQIPLLLALYFVFRGAFPPVNTELLYGFVSVPGAISTHFLGIIDVGAKSIVLAFLAGLTQYLQATLAFRGTQAPSGTGMQADIAKAMGMQVRFVFPFIIGIVAYTTSGAIALYFITTNIAGALQELYVRRKLGPVPETT